MKSKIIIYLLVLITIGFVGYRCTPKSHLAKNKNTPKLNEVEVVTVEVIEAEGDENRYKKDFDLSSWGKVDKGSYLNIQKEDNESTTNTIKSAVDYFVQRVGHQIPYYWFYNYEHGSTSFPQPMKLTEDEDYWERHIDHVIPTNERVIADDDEVKGKNLGAYKTIVESLSAHRYDYNFHKLYKKFKWLIHLRIDKEEYEETYSAVVDRLLIAHDNIAEDEEYLLFRIENIMTKHYNDNLKQSKDLSDSHGIEYLMSEEVKTEWLKTFDKPESLTDYQHNYIIVWSHSFWFRRGLENNSDDIYKTLCAIRNDYKAM